MSILKKFDTESICEEGAWMHLLIPDSEEKAYLDAESAKPQKPMRIKLKGPECDHWQAFLRKSSKPSAQEEAKKQDPSETKLHDAQLLAKMTLGWENIPDDNEKPIEFSKDSAIKLYMSYADIRRQALNFIMRRQNFTKGAAKA